MTRKPIGTFARTEKAELAADDLGAAGVPAWRIRLSPAVRNEANTNQPTDEGAEVAGVENTAEPNEAHFLQAMSMGWTVLTAEVDDSLAETAMDVLRRAGAIGLDRSTPAETPSKKA